MSLVLLCDGYVRGGVYCLILVGDLFGIGMVGLVG